jgi:hypothetical protein
MQVDNIEQDITLDIGQITVTQANPPTAEQVKALACKVDTSDYHHFDIKVYASDGTFERYNYVW